jgi:hypothetical protein
MKFVEGMSLCNKQESELIGNINTRAIITITCDFEHEGFCTYHNSSCDFHEIITKKDAVEYNNIYNNDEIFEDKKKQAAKRIRAMSIHDGTKRL